MSFKTILSAATIGTSAAFLWELNRRSLKSSEKEQRNGSIVNCATSFPGDGDFNSRLEIAKAKSRDVLLRVKDEVGAPGLVVGVSVNGKVIWREGNLLSAFIGFSYGPELKASG